MEKIQNHNFKGMCIEKFCSNKYTHVSNRVVNGMDIVLCFCKEHSERFESVEFQRFFKDV